LGSRIAPIKSARWLIQRRKLADAAESIVLMLVIASINPPGAVIRSIQTDGTYESNAAVREAMEIAIRVKHTAALTITPRLPD